MAWRAKLKTCHTAGARQCAYLGRYGQTPYHASGALPMMFRVLKASISVSLGRTL